jgi:hypothetical protein
MVRCRSRRALLVLSSMTLAAAVPLVSQGPAAAAGGSTTMRTFSKATTTTYHAATMGGGAPSANDIAPDLEGLAATSAGTSKTPVANRSGSSRARALRTGPLPGAVATALPIGSTSATVGQQIAGLNLYDQRTANGGNQFTVEPPDQALCVGNGHVIEATNDVIKIYGTDGSTQAGTEDLNTFLGYPAQFVRPSGPEGPFVTDPVCLFDAPTQTFFLVTLTLDVTPAGAFTGKNTLDVATAQDPTGAWSIYHLPVQDDGTEGTPDHGSACPCIGDYPHIGADANGFYISTNEYPFFANGFVAAQVYAFPKAALASGSPDVTGVQIDTSGMDNGKPGFTVWPAVSPAGEYATRAGGTEWFLSSNAAEETGGNYHGTQVVAWALTGTSTLSSATPAVALRSQALGVPDYYLPPAADQKTGSVPLADCLNTTSCEKALLGRPSKFKESESRLDASDTRMQQVTFTGGQLYGALGTAVALPSGTKAGIAYYVLTPTTTRSGAVSASVDLANAFGVDGNNVTYPTLGVTQAGKGVLSFTLVGRDFYPSQAFTTLTTAAAPARVQITGAGAGPQDGFSGYRAFGDPPRPRWGDYGASSVVDGTIWTANEWIGQTCTLAQYTQAPFGRCGGTRVALGNWGTYISAVTP